MPNLNAAPDVTTSLKANPRIHGEFFTPFLFAQKGLDYLEQTLGKAWWQSGEYRLWDMAAGSGNLEHYLPAEAYQYCYLSTLYAEDTKHLYRLFQEATIFQYDYLNDDTNNLFKSNGEFDYETTWKLPANLRRDLQNPAIKWVVLLNPPFATAQTAGTTSANKADVAHTEVRKAMHRDDLGETSRELTMQFLYRIHKEFRGCKVAYLGLFYKIKYINANNDQRFRDAFFQYRFERGFVFSSANFDGTSKNRPFPVGFLIWQLSTQQPLENQDICLDVLNDDAEKIGIKRVPTTHRSRHLNKWIARPAAVKHFPPFSSGITIRRDAADVRDRVSNGFLASFMCGGNDFQHQNQTCLLSGPCVSAGAMSVTPANFEQCMVVHAIRLLFRPTWLNDRDQFMQPNTDLPTEFVDDCVIWSIFNHTNQTVAIRDVEYRGMKYQIPCNFFPYSIREVKSWQPTDPDITMQLATAEERFVASWVAERTLSSEAEAVLNAGREVYRLFFQHLYRLRTKRFEVTTWDAGFWQIRNLLTDCHDTAATATLGIAELSSLKAAHQILRQKLQPKVYEYGFLVE